MFILINGNKVLRRTIMLVDEEAQRRCNGEIIHKIVHK
jgi:hypothetical protein